MSSEDRKPSASSSSRGRGGGRRGSISSGGNGGGNGGGGGRRGGGGSGRGGNHRGRVGSDGGGAGNSNAGGSVAAASGGRGRGRCGSGSGGRGPKHFGNERQRPDCINPKLLVDVSDDEQEEEVNEDLKVEAEEAISTIDDSKPSPIDNNIHLDLERQQKQQLQEPSSPSNNHRHTYCLICYSSKLSTRRTISPCGHDDVCWACHLQMRYLHSDSKCPVCKTTNETLIVDTDDITHISELDTNDGSIIHHKRFAQYEIWGNDLGKGYVYREDVGMHFPKGTYEKHVLPLLGYGCGIPNCEYWDGGEDMYVSERDLGSANGKQPQPQPTKNSREAKKRLAGLPALKAHLRSDHGYALCDLCVDNKRDFVSKLSRYTPSGLQRHEAKGDGEHSGFNGHPLCEFCKPLRFYDILKLHEHLNKEHYKCHLCDRRGKPNQFFKDYTSLERHFDREHYLCHDAQCLAARFVVFENEIDMRGHEASVHGTSRRDGGTKIKLEFRVRREGEDFVSQHQNVPSGEDFQFGLNGEAFVPEALPDQQRQVNEPVISHPLHAARTAELRAQAAMVRLRDGSGGGNDTEDFPSLAMDAPSTAPGMLVGWTTAGARAVAGRAGGLRTTAVGTVTEEEFPSLGPGPSVVASRNIRAFGLGQSTKKPQALKAGPKFAAVASRQSATPMSAVSYSSHILTNVPDLSRDNFPSLGSGPTPFVPTIRTASSRATPNLKSSDDFPCLGGASSSIARGMGPTSNPYAAVQAHARKLREGSVPFPSLTSSSDFPPPPTSHASKKANNINSFFVPKKPPPMDNILQFPPPSASAAKMHPAAENIEAGKDVVQSLKHTLGAERYKKLRGLTKDFAMGNTPPERYVDGIASLFDQGLGDKAFWDMIPSLIIDIPNEKAVNSAMHYLESVRMVYQMQIGNNKTANSWANSNSSGGHIMSAQHRGDNAPSNNTTIGSFKKTNAGNKKGKSKKETNEIRALAFGF